MIRSLKYILKFLIILSLLIAVTNDYCYAQGSKKGNKKSSSSNNKSKKKSSDKEYTKKADAKFDDGDYNIAIALYSKVLSKRDEELTTKQKSKITYQIAESYNLLNKFESAEEEYYAALELNYPYKRIFIKLAEIQMLLGKFDDAISSYKSYLEKDPQNKVAKAGIASCKLAKEWTKNPTPHDVKPFRKISSKFNDFTDVYEPWKAYNEIKLKETVKNLKEKISSIGDKKEEIEDEIEKEAKDKKDTKKNKGDKKKKEKKKKDDKSKSEKELKIDNPIYNNGVPVLSKDGKTLYYSECIRIGRNEIDCQIYTAEIEEEYWGEASVLKLLDGNSNAFHPSVSIDGTTMYFVANIEGGYGRNDIWMTKLNDGRWGTPVNLGPEINSEYDEVNPFIREDSVLFFSSNRQPGMGGLDIFMAKPGKNGKYTVENLKYPINSVSDDYGIVYQREKERGIFGSNRNNRKDNLYSFDVQPDFYSLEGTIKETETEIKLSGASIRLQGSDGTKFNEQTDEEGEYKFMLKPNTEYKLFISKEKFVEQKRSFKTDSIHKSKTIIKDISLISLGTDKKSRRAGKNKGVTKRADLKFEQGEYFKAIKIYEKITKNKKKSKKISKEDKAVIAFQLGECYNYINDTRKAASQYKKAIRYKYPDPQTHLKLAEVHKMNEKLEDAILEYQAYIELVPDDSTGHKGIVSCELAKEWTDNPTRYEVENFKEINSKHSDFCAAMDARKEYKDIYFTSTREGIHEKLTSTVTGHLFSDIFVIKFNRKEEWDDPEPLDSIVNSIYDDGTPFINKKGNTLYFSRCRKEKKKDIGCQIYISQKEGGYWGKASKVEVLKDNTKDSISVAHPALSPDESELYFVSDMDGGYGKNDIWKVTNNGGSWEDPTNLGPEINSEFDEMNPYIRDDSVLFFSSDKYPTMGGLDIFMAKKDSTGAYVVENMKYPINSVADDFGISFQGIKEKGLISSSRSRRRDNIFWFEIPPLSFKLEGIVKDLDSEEILMGAVVKLIGSDGTMFRDTTDEEGKFSYKLKPNTDYIFVASKDGYLNFKGSATTDSLNRSKVFAPDIFLKPYKDPITLDNILYEFGSAELMPESTLELNKLIEILNENPNIVIELASHADMIGDEQRNLILSDERAQSVVKYLIAKGISNERLKPKGYGENKPRKVDEKLAEKYDFLNVDDVLDPEFVLNLDEDKQEIANQINRRTEFQVLSNKYVSESGN